VNYAQLTAGSVRAKSAKSVCLKNIMDAAFGGCAYFLLGWGFAYGDAQSCDENGVCTDVNNAFIGTNNFAMSVTPSSSYASYYFQYVVRSSKHNDRHTQVAC
jgi:Amt family ammonium transporter